MMNNNSDVDSLDLNSFFIRKRMFSNFSENTNNNQQLNTGGEVALLLQNNNDDVSRIFAFKNSQHAMSIQKFSKEKNNEALFDDNSRSNDQNGKEDDVRTGGGYNNQHRVFKILVCQPDHRKSFVKK